MNNTYKSLPNSRQNSLENLAITSKAKDDKSGNTVFPVNEQHGKILESCEQEISRYQRELESIRQMTFSPENNIVSSETIELKMQNSRLTAQVKTLTEQAESLKRENSGLSQQLETMALVRTEQATSEAKLKTLISNMSKDIDAMQFDNRLKHVETDLRSFYDEIKHQATVQPADIISGIWRRFTKQIKEYPEDRQPEIDSLQKEVTKLRDKVVSSIVNKTVQSKQSISSFPTSSSGDQTMASNAGSGGIHVNDIGEERLKALLSQHPPDKNKVGEFVGRLMNDIKNPMDSQKVMKTLKQTIMHESLDDEEFEIVPHGVEDQIRILTEVTDEHIETASRLKKDNKVLRDDISFLEEKMMQRELAWKSKIDTADTTLSQLDAEKRKFHAILDEYSRQYSYIACLLPKITGPKSSLETGGKLYEKIYEQHPLQFIQQAESLYAINQSTLHTLDHVRESKEKVVKELQQQKVKVEALIEDFKGSQLRAHLAETQKADSDRQVTALKKSVTELAEQIQELSDEKASLQTKLLRVGQGFAKLCL